jgi:hypothetical protein
MLGKDNQAPLRPRRNILQSCLLLSVMGDGQKERLFKLPNERKDPMTDDELSIIIRRFSTAFILGQRVVSASDYPFTLVEEEKRVASRRLEIFLRRKKQANPNSWE